MILAEQSELKEREMAFKLASAAADLPHTIAHAAAGEVDAPIVVADIFSLMSRVRLCTTAGFLIQANSSILLAEYEALAERFSASVHPSPFVSVDDLAVPDVAPTQGLPERKPGLLGSHAQPLAPKTGQGHSKEHTKDISQGLGSRAEKILSFVRENPQSSIKDIASVIRNCSEKTIQRELAVLIAHGLVKKIGERRWSVYVSIG